MKKNPDLNNLKIIYSQLYELSIQIGQLIDRELYNELMPYLNKKDQLLAKSNELVKKLVESSVDLSELEDICKKIGGQEKANINALTMARDEIKKELHKTSKNTKLVSAYSGAEAVQGKILDFRE